MVRELPVVSGETDLAELWVRGFKSERSCGFAFVKDRCDSFGLTRRDAA
jgi:hypothetical protein